MAGEESAAGPWQGTAAAGEYDNETAELADPEVLEGELLPPLKALRQHLSIADEVALGEQIRAEHEADERSLNDAVKHFRRCGEKLLRAKAEMGHGLFGHFLKTTVKLHPRSAQRYMLLSRELAKLPTADATRVSQLSLRDAIGELARTSSRATKLQPESLSRALRDARRKPLKQCMVVSTNAERCPTTSLAQVVDRSGTPPAPLP